MTQVKYEFPPNIAAIRAKLKPTDRTVFTYGDTIYVPSGTPMTPDLRAHEDAHVIQQKHMGADAWWAQYLTDPMFRLEQELQAYQSQWQFMQRNYGRTERRKALKHISRDLAGPMYGNLMSKSEAEVYIRGGA